MALFFYLDGIWDIVCVNTLDMNNYLMGYGLNNGISLFDKSNHITCLSNEKIIRKKNSRIGQIADILFVRGFLLFFYFLYNFVRDLDNTVNIMNKRQRIWTPIIFISLILAFFVVLPLPIYFLLNLMGSTVLANLIFAIYKSLLIIVFFGLLRFITPFKQIYQYNFCYNKSANAYKKSGWTYEDYYEGDRSRVLTNFNFFIFSMILIYSILPLVNVNNLFLSVFLKILCFTAAICIAYEWLFVIEYNRKYSRVMKVFAYPFVWLDRLTTVIPSEKQQKVSLRAMEELYLMNTQVKTPKTDSNFTKVYTSVKKRLYEAGISDKAETDWLIASALNKNRNEIFLVDNISDKDIEKINKLVEKRTKRIPLNKIIGKQNFYGYDFIVNRNVLAPRMETEILVEKAIEYIGGGAPQVLDMCTGSGCIAVVVAKETKAKVTAVDVCSKALNVAQKNAAELKAKVKFVKSNMFQSLPINKKFDIILSNPPYIKSEEIPFLDPEVREYEPRKSLDGGKDGLKYYRTIAEQAPKYLKKGGVLMLEIGFYQGEEVSELLSKNFKNVEVIKDFGDLPRIIIAKKG